MTREEKIKSVILTIYDEKKLADTIEGFSEMNNESSSERLFRAFEAEGLDIKEFLGLDYLTPVKFEYSVWNS